MTVKAHAKINWTLRVLGKRNDGFHDLKSIVLPVEMHDVIEISEDEEIACSTAGLEIAEENNLAYRAAVALRDASGGNHGARIAIEKNIPSGAGLGGGSSDAAAVLNALNAIWKIDFPVERLCEIGAKIGSDIPALVLGGPVLMEGRGERVRKIDDCLLRELNESFLPPAESIEVYWPGIFVPTSEVFGEFKESDCNKGPNDLQRAAIRLYPEIEEALRYLENRGLKHVAMTGSGSAVFGVRA
ncbi:MAG: 4-(cytidine 5'-diphospho)-2-C-methyl-D-erythritol kinase [Kiritimatiellae bacterium]|nr:4-(cytidine 5'-diphospho)-2-C-methyl-D-erythritol kinase [Kiritimatiellia bacterium]